MDAAASSAAGFVSRDRPQTSVVFSAAGTRVFDLGDPAMRRLALAFLAAGCVAFAGSRGLLADDPAPKAPLSEDEQTRVRQLIDNLGSDDFRIREAATKELTEMGARVRAELEAAQKSTVPEVRFRADQILRKIDGRRAERRLGEKEPGTPPRPRAVPRLGSGFSNEEYERHMKEIEEQMRQLRESLNSGFGQGGFRFGPDVLGGLELGSFRSGGGRFRAESADLHVTTRSAQLKLAEKAPDGSPVTVTYEAKTVDLILAAHPELRERPGVLSVVDQAAKAKEAARAPAGGSRGLLFGPGGRVEMTVNGTKMTVVDGHATVTFEETLPDGQVVQRKYEGKDLEEIKREHPEVASRLSVFHFNFGTPIVPQIPGIPGGLGEEDDDDATGAAAPHTGPFGLALGRLDDAQRARSGLAEGAGVVVLAVRPGSDAAAAGLEVGDVVTTVNGSAVRADVGLAPQVQAGRAAGSLVFEVLRAGKGRTLTWKK
jgi:hypothetical protein